MKRGLILVLGLLALVAAFVVPSLAGDQASASSAGSADAGSSESALAEQSDTASGSLGTPTPSDARLAVVALGVLGVGAMSVTVAGRRRQT